MTMDQDKEGFAAEYALGTLDSDDLETGLIAGVLLFLGGLGMSVYALSDWRAHSFGALDPSSTLRLVIPAATLITLGLQTILSSFFLSILGLKRH